MCLCGCHFFIAILYMYVIAIPTYNRSDVIFRKTITTLLNGGINYKHIFIFVANAKEKNTYAAALPDYKIIVGKLGIANQRIFIRNFFKPGQYVVSIDDDIEQVLTLHKDKLAPIKDLHSFFLKAYDDLKRERKYMWGIYPVRNPFFMKQTTSTGLSFIIGALHGFIVRHDKKLNPSTLAEGKEDYEQSILYFLRDGGVIRYNFITIKTKFLAKGGLGEDRFERNKLSADFLFHKYPNLVTIFHRANGMTEIRIRDKSSKTRKLSSHPS